MIVRHDLPLKWRALYSLLEDLRDAFPKRVARRIFRFNQRMLAIDARRRTA